MTPISILGLIAAVLTIGAYIPQAYKTIKTKLTSDLSESTFSMSFIRIISWFFYGIFIKDTTIMLANGITETLSGIIFYLKLISKTNGKN